MSAGNKRERLTFQVRADGEDDYGNYSEAWEDQFTEAARVMPLRGREAVQEARLSGVQPYVVTIWYNERTATVEPDWRAVDARDGAVYNIRTVANMDEKKRELELLVERGVAT